MRGLGFLACVRATGWAGAADPIDRHYKIIISQRMLRQQLSDAMHRTQRAIYASNVLSYGGSRSDEIFLEGESNNILCRNGIR